MGNTLPKRVGTCVECKEDRILPTGRNVCHPCKYARHGRARIHTPSYKVAQASYYKRNPHFRRYKSNRHFDKVNAYESLTFDEYKVVVHEDAVCFYCGDNELLHLGLDRLDNQRGHAPSNVVACCEKCNNLLSDIPYEAKLELRPGLAAIHKKGLLKQWTIPTKRRTQPLA